jgi:hypothetical protein
MKQQPDVADRQLRDFADLLVTEIALKLQVDDFALVFRQVFDESEDFAGGFFLFEIRIETDFCVLKWRHASLSFPSIEGEVPANGKEPLRDVTAHFCGAFTAEAQKGLLNDFPRPFGVAKNPGGVPDQLVFVLSQGIDDPL